MLMMSIKIVNDTGNRTKIVMFLNKNLWKEPNL